MQESYKRIFKDICIKIDNNLYNNEIISQLINNSQIQDINECTLPKISSATHYILMIHHSERCNETNFPNMKQIVHTYTNNDNHKYLYDLCNDPSITQ